MRPLAALAVASLAVGCCRESGSGAPSPTSAAPLPPAALPAFSDPPSERPWACRTVLHEDARVVRERVCFRSGSLQIVGQVCRPRRDGRFPVVVYAHASLFGLGPEWQGGACQAIAADGYVVVMPSFRGQDGSDGKVEGCLGEVDDAVAMHDMALAQPYADGRRTAWVGASHGGCVALRALARGTEARAAAALFPATDWTALYTSWSERAAQPGPANLTKLYKDGAAELVRSFGGTPATHPAEYQRRSVSAADLAKNPTPLLLAHGAADPLVPVAGTCKLAASLEGVSPFHLTARGETSREIVAGCDKLTPSEAGADLLRTKARVLGLYDGGVHDLTTPVGQRMARDAWAFLKPRLDAAVPGAP
ncbi:MAG: prolyl oligopeptidase family serine peptidase [Polyangiaceae bacterium]|nr:prolyl oligopeptidase family serine peptidase [Polyangiaceae bacterium]